jgi:mRNA-degrading endonuclease RelE of RelBE toxin-antitoxin system
LIQVLYSPSFKRDLRKLHSEQKQNLLLAIKDISDSKVEGIPKRFDLAGVFIYKYKAGQNEVLIAYEFVGQNTVRFLKFGSHENFYRDLKRGN